MEKKAGRLGQREGFPRLGREGPPSLRSSPFSMLWNCGNWPHVLPLHPAAASAPSLAAWQPDSMLEEMPTVCVPLSVCIINPTGQ